MRVQQIFAALSFGLQTATATALVSSPGETSAIPSWHLESTAKSGSDLKALSRPGVDTSSWHHIKTSKCTLMGCLIEAGVYNETDLFYSDNLRKVDEKQFLVPWIYHSEFALKPGPGKHFFLQTHGISSRADIFLNGKEVVSKSEQAGSFVGKRYDITKLVGKANTLAIQAYPTDYYRDLALGWVDWNPWPADNGTGVWRDVEIKQTGSVVLDPLRVVTQLGANLGREPAKVSLKAKAQNLKNSPVTITATGHVTPLSGGRPVIWTKTLTLPPLSVTDISLDAIVKKPAIWWPRQWGEQPLYSAKMTIKTDGAVSDYAETQFGFRTVTSKLNSHNDTTFFINGHPFQVIGAGYAPNMFLRWDAAKWEAELKYVLDLGLNTVRLEGKNEHPEAYRIANRLGIMLMAGWECCDKWEAWEYNHDLAAPSPPWTDEDYAIAHASMAHEAAMLQPHPSVLTYLIGSDYWPDDRATPLYLSALHSANWQTPITSSASARGFSPLTGPSGMKMDGPYDWVPPSYWFTPPTQSLYTYGAAFGFGSELSAGVGTPTLPSLPKFLSAQDQSDLWQSPNKRLFHMSRNPSQFTTREIYNAALWARWGEPTSLDDYIMKSQIMDYEATRAQIEAYRARWGVAEKERPATGVVYWMLNGAWPSLHWGLWDWWMRPGGAYFGAKTAARRESVVFDVVGKGVWWVSGLLGDGGSGGRRRVEVDVMGLDGRVVFEGNVVVRTRPNGSGEVVSLAEILGKVKDIVFVKLVLKEEGGRVLSRNVYWVGNKVDELDWERTDWYVTPVSKYADFTALNKLAPAKLEVVAVRDGNGGVAVKVKNLSGAPAFFVSFSLVDGQGEGVLPITWEDNYVTLWPGEKMTLRARAVRGKWKPAAVQVLGKNVEARTVSLGGA